jgi:hypothetical protein
MAAVQRKIDVSSKEPDELQGMHFSRSLFWMRYGLIHLFCFVQEFELMYIMDALIHYSLQPLTQIFEDVSKKKLKLNVPSPSQSPG